MSGGSKTFTAFQYSGITNNKPGLYEWCKKECDSWDGCEAIMNFQENSSRDGTAKLGICHMFFGAADLAAAKKKWEASPLQKTQANGAACGNGTPKCWYFLPSVYAEKPIERKKKVKQKL